MENIKKIQISRSKFIEESRPVAILRLNEYKFLKGEPVMLNYYKKNPDLKTDIDTLVAIGIKDGVGEDCYRIISAGGTVPVRGVVDEIPDVSALVHGELYVLHYNQTWFYVYLKEGQEHRTVEAIPKDRQYIFLDLTTGYRWFYKNQECRREDDYFSKVEIDKVLSQILERDATLEVNSESGTIFKTGGVHDITLSVFCRKKDGTDVSDKCTYQVNDVQVLRGTDGHIVVPNINKTSTLSVVAKYNISQDISVTLQKDIVINFGYDFYYGIVPEDWKVTSSEKIKELSKKELRTRTNLKWTGINLSLQKLAIAYPAAYGRLTHILDIHGIDYLSDYTLISSSDFKIDEFEYYVYVKLDPVTIDNFEQNYIFDLNSNQGGTGGGSSSGFDPKDKDSRDLLDAWFRRNTPGGLIVLNGNGKIPETILPESTQTPGKGTGGVSFLIDITDTIPTFGEEGDAYYIPTEKKIYTCKGGSEFVISSPVKNLLYVNKKNKSQYYWNNGNMVALGSIGSSVILDLTEIL